jgi:hypothetical protein
MDIPTILTDHIITRIIIMAGILLITDLIIMVLTIQVTGMDIIMVTMTLIGRIIVLVMYIMVVGIPGLPIPIREHEEFTIIQQHIHRELRNGNRPLVHQELQALIQG